MTHIPIKWTRVLFGAGLTLIVAISPVLYLLLVAPSPDGRTREVASDGSFFGLASNGFDLGSHRSAFFLLVGVFVSTVMLAVTVASRSQQSEPSNTYR